MLDWTRIRLRMWGGWCRKGIGLGLPSVAAFMRANTGGRAAFDGLDMPEHIQEVESAILRVASPHKLVLREVYCHTGSLELKAAKRGTTVWRLRQDLKRAEIAVTETLYPDATLQFPHSMGYVRRIVA